MNLQSRFLVICLVLGFISNALCLAQKQFESTNADVDDDEYYNDYEDYNTGNENKTPDNTNNNIESPKPLTVIEQEPPYFEQTELHISAYPNSDVLFNCDVRNFHVNNVVIWYKDETAYANGQYSMNQRVETLKNNSIILKNVEDDDAGNYYCEVHPDRIRLHVILEIKKTLTIVCDGRDVLDRTIVYREGESHVCECRTDGVGDDNIKWYLNSQRIDDSIGELDQGSLVLSGIDDHHNGIYQCLDDDGSEKPKLGMFNIVVHFKPKVTTHRHHINTDIGGTAELYCDYRGDPIAITHWIKNDQPLSYSEKYMITYTMERHFNRSILTVKDVTIDDLGEYRCVAENSIGSNEVKTHLMLEPEKGQLENVTIDGKVVKLNWLVRSLQPLSEAMLNYKLSGGFMWSSTTVIHTKRHENDSSMWKVTHEMELTPGEWQTRMRTKNMAGWSQYSSPFVFDIADEDDESNNASGKETLAMAGFGSSRSASTSIHLCFQSILFVSLLFVAIYN